ncbi:MULTISPECIES: E3 ubiquitin ligase family protein [unclassified Thermosynechococcus]|uniref:E3 ubiquitin ligase family protein n=1 Tax=unclassified Thermosynechococcus TaxID=2622553 RepID=UPI002672D77F|nr:MULTISPECIES: E3 ubiquitin ligase family protein [unclassified Thermosynechococcus]MDR7897115.1 E3 ubiquitin ligase family protein [Thermosynechococcus sp. JY1332]MDR7904513.1 E3 ubiquitin ligase family protein [Thermosynechococcus sp. JY1334]MDR7920994.1 E3 ubiquitin ligase family protein [Thermosynechococcus sp. HY213]MDR7992350.1 E3 ubiquitin ligase family protein [Thermosynechococcus sp. TG252]WKT86752.1 E3 ubiquitin ligase family protein [Thermosynechococcus sp. JY1339]
MGIFGGLLLIAAIALFFVQRHYRLKLRSLKLATPSTTADLHQLQQQVAQEIGGGNLREYVKVSGQIVVDQPLISELKQVPCVHYRMCVSREYEEQVRETDSEGRTRWRTERRSDTISSNSQTIPFRVRDRYGEIEVDPRGADMETVQVLDEFRPANNTARFGFGSFQVNVGSLTFGSGNTIGYRYQEWITPVDRQVLVVGTASDQTGTLRIERPTVKGQKFFVSLKSEDSLSQDTSNAVLYSTIGAAACGGLGILLILVGLL